MKQTSYDTVLAEATRLEQENPTLLSDLVGLQQAATCIANIYWNYDTVRVQTQHYVPTQRPEYNGEITIIATPTMVSAISTMHAHYFRNNEPYVLFDNLQEDITAIQCLIQLVLQFVL